ncbi:MAG: ATP-binding cassette domain-containing protein [Candidatus Hydrothermarchaeales archaeon]
MSEVSIKVEGLTKVFDGLTAVDHISFEVEEGEIFGLLGPNGAGKTTTINMLTTLAKPTSGSAYIMGMDVSKEPIKVKKAVGVIPQYRTLDKELTARENLLVHGECFGLSKKDRKARAEELLELVGLSSRADNSIRGFSGGMLQRLLITRALMHRPEVLFLDEPTVGLDPQTRRAIWGYIQKLNKEGLTMFLTTHYMEEADHLCGRIAIMDDGKIVKMGEPDKLKDLIPGGDAILARVLGPSPGLLEKLRALPEVREVKEQLENEVAEYLIYLDRGEVILPSIVDIIRDEARELKSVNFYELTLEDVFIELTGKELRD